RPTAVPEFEDDTNGTYAGIGVLMANEVAPITVLFPFPGGPAERAGLAVGDRIVAVEGTPLEAPTPRLLMHAARERLPGPPGPTPAIGGQRGAAPPFPATVERARVQKASAKWARLLDAEHGIGYVYLSGFQPGSTAELRSAVQELRDADGGLRALV